MSSSAVRSRSVSAPSGSSNTCKEPTCIGCSRDSPMRNIESVGDIKAMRLSYPRFPPLQNHLVSSPRVLTVSGMVSTLRHRLQADLRVALENRDALRLSVLRTTLSALSNAEAVDPGEYGAPEVTEVPRRVLTDSEMRAVVERERDELRATARGMHRVGAHDRARQLLGQADVLDGYLAGWAGPDPRPATSQPALRRSLDDEVRKRRDGQRDREVDRKGGDCSMRA